MQNPEKTTELKNQQSKDAIVLLEKLLKMNDAQGIREDLNQIFYGYISSEFSDCQSERNQKYGSFLLLIEFLTKLDKLNTLNRWAS